MTWEDWRPALVVVGTDGSEGSRNAAAVAATLARRNRAALHIVTVVRPPEGWWGIAGGPPTAGALSNALIDAQREILDSTINALDLEGLEWESSEEVGDPAATLVAYCGRVDADVLVVGRRGAGLLERIVIGSVADRVTHQSPCPVLVVP
jgi:nucleotide-binding universal stress UspA family protein